MMFLIGAVCVVFGFLVGVVLTHSAVRAKKTEDENAKIINLAKTVTDTINIVAKLSSTFSNMTATQDKVIQSLQREKRLLAKQLESSTEIIQDLEAALESHEEEGEEDDEDDDEPKSTEVSTKLPIVRNRKVAEVRPFSTAENKLMTVEALLQDAHEKGTPVDPANLLGIIKVKPE